MEWQVSQLTLEQKIGQMIMCGFEGTVPSTDILRLIRERGIGGVIYFARNVKDVRQVAALSAMLQKAAVESGSPPLWIGIDQEGGMVARLTEGVALMPGAMAIAAGGSREAAFEAARICGTELKALGINLNYAPVLDVNNNPANPVIGVRSFGESPETVGRYGTAFIRGLQEAGVAATAKHFPGHGDTSVDSHLDLPTVAHDRARIEAVELAPFRQAFETGVDAVMSAHIVFPSYESNGLPATLSRAVLTGLLREKLGFEGVVMTDCMEMNAISVHYGTVQAAVMAVEAGADLVLVSHRHDLQAGAISALLEAVRSGRISEERIDRSVRRLLALKRKRIGGASVAELSEEALRCVGSAEHQAVARRISEASMTLVRNAGAVLPLKPVRTFVINVQAAATAIVDDVLKAPLTLGGALAAEGLKLREETVPPDEEAIMRARERLIGLALEADQLVVATYNAILQPAQAELVRSLLALGKPIAVVAARSPYDLLAFPDVPAYLAAYESRPLAMRSAARVLLGHADARGRLPVSVGERYPAGSVSVLVSGSGGELV